MIRSQNEWTESNSTKRSGRIFLTPQIWCERSSAEETKIPTPRVLLSFYQVKFYDLLKFRILLKDFWDSGFEVPEFLSDAPFSALATLRTSVISVGLGEEPNEIIGQITALNQPENFIKVFYSAAGWNFNIFN